MRPPVRQSCAADALSGKLAFVEGAQAATHFAVFIDDGIAVAASDAPGVTIKATPGLAVPSFSEVTFDNTPAIRVSVPRETLADISLMVRLACANRALGAAQRAFEMAVEHAKVRKQFGQPIGQFQAIQHKLANCLISLDGAQMALETAAAARDGGNPDWRTFASAAIAFAGPALRTVSIETHRALGAIGYAEEHEAPRHFRRVHADLARFGGAPRARAELAEYPARTRLDDRPSRPRHGPRRQRLPQGGARLAREELDGREARGAPEQAVQGPRLGRRVLQD